MESTTGWQVIFLCGIAFWTVISSILNKYQNRHLDALFSGLSCVVSVPFDTAFLPLLFWTGHCKLARQMTLLMALCDYTGNCIKDAASAPRPSSPPVRRITATKDEEDNAMEYGFPSSHTLNTVCLSGYLLHYILAYNGCDDAFVVVVGFTLVCLIVSLIGFARIYLGMHSLIDIIGGLALGLSILAIWLCVSEYIDSFIVSGQNVISFWAALTFLLLFAYPTPELPTPSYEYHTAFNGVALGIVIGVHQTYQQFHHEDVARIFSPQLPFSALVGRLLLGIPTILVVKFCIKALAKWIIPVLAYTLGIPIKSTSYVPALKGVGVHKKASEMKQSSYVQRLLFFSRQTSFDVALE